MRGEQVVPLLEIPYKFKKSYGGTPDVGCVTGPTRVLWVERPVGIVMGRVDGALGEVSALRFVISIGRAPPPKYCGQ